MWFLHGINNNGAEVNICITMNILPIFMIISLSPGFSGNLSVIKSGAAYGNDKNPVNILIKYRLKLIEIDLKNIFLILLSMGLLSSWITGKTMNWQQYEKQHTQNPGNILKSILTQLIVYIDSKFF